MSKILCLRNFTKLYLFFDFSVFSIFMRKNENFRPAGLKRLRFDTGNLLLLENRRNYMTLYSPRKSSKNKTSLIWTPRIIVIFIMFHATFFAGRLRIFLANFRWISKISRLTAGKTRFYFTDVDGRVGVGGMETTPIFGHVCHCGWVVEY